VGHPVPTAGCGQAPALAPGRSGDETVAVDPATDEGSATRSYRVHVPTGYHATLPIPVVLAFHGYSGTAAGMEGLTGFSTLADQQGFLAVYPQGLSDGQGGAPFWASIGPVDYGIDDVRYVSNVLDAVERTYCVDVRRIYATGFSNGGGMTAYLACALSERIAAFAPVAGNFYAIPGGCHPGRPISILDYHGTADQVVPYVGIPTREVPDWPLPSIPRWLASWAARDGCSANASVFYQSGHLTGIRWTGCQAGAEIIHYREEGAGHVWPPLRDDGLMAAQVMWQFFQVHPLPAA
jgi:polyhydroxybutyrate depolymerase